MENSDTGSDRQKRRCIWKATGDFMCMNISEEKGASATVYGGDNKQPPGRVGKAVGREHFTRNLSQHHGEHRLRGKPSSGVGGAAAPPKQ
jgi:hypothetical protein